MNASVSAAGVASPRPITTSGEAEQFVVHLMDVMDALLGIVEQETTLVRSGRLGQATQLDVSKADLTRLYVSDIARLKASHAFLAQTLPGVLEALHRRHDMFRALLQVNLTVLATAHAVSEGIVRGVSQEMARKASPSGYGANGHIKPPRPGVAQPLAVSRVL